MSTHDVPGAKAKNADVLAMGCWAEHEDGSLIFVEATETGTVVYSIFDLRVMREYRDAMPEVGFKDLFTWRPEADDADDNLQWTWHDKTPFPWSRVMRDFPSGERHVSATDEMTAAQRVADSLNLRAERIRDREVVGASALTVGQRVKNALRALVD